MLCSDIGRKLTGDGITEWLWDKQYEVTWLIEIWSYKRIMFVTWNPGAYSRRVRWEIALTTIFKEGFYHLLAPKGLGNHCELPMCYRCFRLQALLHIELHATYCTLN